MKTGNLGDNYAVSKDMIKAIQKTHNLKTPEQLTEFLRNLANGKIGNKNFRFGTNIKMQGWVSLPEEASNKINFAFIYVMEKKRQLN